ncbi:Mitochondrial translocator assembly and maintenance protein 41 [Hypoxylon texense]
MAQIFRNVPLDSSRKEIRILRLLPADDDDEVHTELFAASIERDIPYFEAISHAWDLKEPRKSITVNGHQFEISESIYILLKNLQYLADVASGMNFWIDSICINREDMSEKSAQVPLMKDIYTKASQVLIWLGDGDECTDRAIETTGSVNHWSEDSAWSDDLNWPVLSSMSTEDGYTADTLSTFTPVLKGVNDVFGREWFRRTWTLQEAILSPDIPQVLCGKSSLSWQC